MTSFYTLQSTICINSDKLNRKNCYFIEDDVIEHDKGSINDDPSTNENSPKDMYIPQSIEIDINKIKSKQEKNLEAPKNRY